MLTLWVYIISILAFAHSDTLIAHVIHDFKVLQMSWISHGCSISEWTFSGFYCGRFVSQYHSWPLGHLRSRVTGRYPPGTHPWYKIDMADNKILRAEVRNWLILFVSLQLPEFWCRISSSKLQNNVSKRVFTSLKLTEFSLKLAH